MPLKRKLKLKTKTSIANFFGGFGYFMCCLQWLLVVVVYSSFIKSTLTSLTPAVQTPVQPVPATIHLATNIPAMIIAIIFTVLVIFVAVFVFVKIPSTVAKTTKTIVHEVAESAAPVIIRTQHIPETKQIRRRIVFRMTIIIKALIILLPLIVVYCSQYSPNQVFAFNLSIYLAVMLAALSVVFFALQYIFARLLSVGKSQLW